MTAVPAKCRYRSRSHFLVKFIIQQCWIRLHSSSNNVGATHAHYAWIMTYELYSSHDALHVPNLLGVVASVCTPLPARTQQLPTLLAQQCCGSCCARLHAALDSIDLKFPSLFGCSSANSKLKGQESKQIYPSTTSFFKSPDYVHARASSVFSSKDNRTVILTRQDFLPDRTADGMLFIFSSNILDFRTSLSSYLKFG